MATNQAGSSHTVTVTMVIDGNPVSGVLGTFTVTNGPNAGVSGSGTTDGSGRTSFSYMSNGMQGTDTIQARKPRGQTGVLACPAKGGTRLRVKVPPW